MTPLLSRGAELRRALSRRGLASALPWLLVGASTLATVRLAQAQIPSTPQFIEHYLDRTSFGPTAAERAPLIGNVPQLVAHYQAQVDPFGTPGVPENPDLATVLGFLTLPDVTLPWSPPAAGTESRLGELQLEIHARAMLTARQLNEVMTFFWENCFNTNFGQLQNRITAKLANAGITVTTEQVLDAMVYCERFTNSKYREHALGNFFDLLNATVRSPAMLIYLNADGNKGCTPNENLGRELLELYAMGPTSGLLGTANYVQDDVVVTSQILTGLIVDTAMQQAYDLNNHCTGQKTLTFLPNPIADGGEQEIVDLVTQLAVHPATAEFISRKLVTFFLSEKAAAPGAEDQLIIDMVTTWLGSGGDIPSVLTTLFASPQFLQMQYARQRARIPFERVVSWVRLWDGDLGVGSPSVPNPTTKLFLPLIAVEFLGQSLFTHPTPNGFPIESDKQPSSSGYIENVIYGGDVYRWAEIPNTGLAPWALHPTPGVLGLVLGATSITDPQDCNQVATFLLEHAFVDRHTAADITTLANRLCDGNPTLPDPNTQPTEYITRLLVSLGSVGAMVHAQVKY